jgi:hypothetical protein
MNILAAILILTSTGQASRETTVPVGIERVLWGVVVGGMKDALPKMRGIAGADRRNAAWPLLDVPALYIDGTERTGWGWGEAAYRVAGYAIDSRTGGSVEYVYRLRVRGYDVRRSTRIENGSVVLTTDVWGSIGPKGELYRVHLEIRAVETGDGTRITGYATGYSHIGDRCGLVERIAERIISRELAAVLAEIETGGRALYRDGDIHELGTALIERLTR